MVSLLEKETKEKQVFNQTADWVDRRLSQGAEIKERQHLEGDGAKHRAVASV